MNLKEQTPERPLWETDNNFLNPFKEYTPESKTLGDLLSLSEEEAEDRLESLYSLDWDKPEPIMEIMAGDSPESEIICNVGNWYISTEGDLYYIKHRQWMREGNPPQMNYEGCYCIYSDQLKENDWILHLTEKKWFTEPVLEDFKRAYFIACNIAGVRPVRQIRKY